MGDKRATLSNYWNAANQLENLITPEEYAKRNYCHPHTVRKYARCGRIAGIKIGGKWYVVSVVH